MLNEQSGTIAEILCPEAHGDDFYAVRSAGNNVVGDYLNAIASWYGDSDIKKGIRESAFLGGVWFRGNRKHHEPALVPGVYRPPFTKRAKAVRLREDLENRRLHLERQMLLEFRTSGAAFFDPNDMRAVYLLAQHYGMPTRLLDWTTNPLAALFFAVLDKGLPDKEGEQPNDGEVFIMDASRVLPKLTEKDDDEGQWYFEEDPTRKPFAERNRLWTVATTRHPYVEDAIRQSFWGGKKDRIPLVIPVRPDNQPGRIGQQSSCFTLHMHRAPSRVNPTLRRIRISWQAKDVILDELHRLNINEFTIFNDLDHLSKDIKRAWRID